MPKFGGDFWTWHLGIPLGHLLSIHNFCGRQSNTDVVGRNSTVLWRAVRVVIALALCVCLRKSIVSFGLSSPMQLPSCQVCRSRHRGVRSLFIFLRRFRFHLFGHHRGACARFGQLDRRGVRREAGGGVGRIISCEIWIILSWLSTKAVWKWLRTGTILVCAMHCNGTPQLFRKKQGTPLSRVGGSSWPVHCWPRRRLHTSFIWTMVFRHRFSIKLFVHLLSILKLPLPVLNHFSDFARIWTHCGAPPRRGMCCLGLNTFSFLHWIKGIIHQLIRLGMFVGEAFKSSSVS